MATTLLLNPRKRRASRKGKKRARNPSAAQRRARAAFAARARARRSNPAPRKRARRRVARRSNPIVSYRRSARRRRNPSGRGMGGALTNFRSYIGPLKDAAVMGGGAVVMDLLYGYAQPYLPAMLRRVPGKVGIGDVAKMLLTVAAGKLLARPTRGLSNRAAMGALVVQMRDIVLTFMPAPAASAAATVNGLAFANPARITRGAVRTNGGAVSAFVNSQSPLLAGAPSGGGRVGAFVNSQSPLLAGAATPRGAW